MTYRPKGRPTVFVARPHHEPATPETGDTTAPWLSRGDDDRALFVVVVMGADGPLFTVASRNEELCRFQVVAYIANRLDTQLWPVHATRVRALLDTGDYDAAASLYFQHVGERWDEEWLVTARVDADDVARRWGIGRPDPDQSTAA